MLLFKRKFLDAIRRGEKTQTIRLWKFRRMAPGQRSYIPGVGYIRIESVDEIQLADLTDDDARPDGFPTAVALRDEIAAIYAKTPNGGQKAYRIRFVKVETDEQISKKVPRNQPPATLSRQVANTETKTPDSAASADAQRPASQPIPRRQTALPADGYPLIQNRNN